MNRRRFIEAAFLSLASVSGAAHAKLFNAPPSPSPLKHSPWLLWQGLDRERSAHAWDHIWRGATPEQREAILLGERICDLYWNPLTRRWLPKGPSCPLAPELSGRLTLLDEAEAQRLKMPRLLITIKAREFSRLEQHPHRAYRIELPHTVAWRLVERAHAGHG